jgi:hypothetical protein
VARSDIVPRLVCGQDAAANRLFQASERFLKSLGEENELRARQLLQCERTTLVLDMELYQREQTSKALDKAVRWCATLRKACQ